MLMIYAYNVQKQRWILTKFVQMVVWDGNKFSKCFDDIYPFYGFRV
ncbi:hypothetical protein Pint_30338 [Pistacia integerrima]|uniref:Uncharacterized protein n=1 Tax=Pistacia integerrima TaxID=434235 RepID=A0ACC0X2R1_9ROSI|nr:hypothetical protein Pint_30338 [Pistacia integerrima]